MCVILLRLFVLGICVFFTVTFGHLYPLPFFLLLLTLQGFQGLVFICNLFCGPAFLLITLQGRDPAGKGSKRMTKENMEVEDARREAAMPKEELHYRSY